MSRLRRTRIRSLSTLATVALATTVALSLANSAAAETPPAPPFYQCPAIGEDTSCGLVIFVNPDGTTTVIGDPNQPPIDGVEDTLVGVQNDSPQTVYMISISSLSSTAIFDFDWDGICSGVYIETPSGCPFGPSRYEGPNTSFKVTDGNNGTVNFPLGLAPGASTYFSLAATATAASIVIPRYVAMGDSYSSGEGVPPFFSYTDSPTNKCHRSWRAYPELIQNRTGVPSTVEFWACSGAQIRSFYNSSWGEPRQLDDLNGSPATLVTLGVGGNDIGFERIVRTCTDVWVPFRGQQNRDYRTNCGNFLDQPGQLQPNNLINGLTTGNFNAYDNAFYSLRTLYQDVKVRAPLARVFVVGYPNPLPPPNAVNGDCQADVLKENGSTTGFGPYHVQFTIHQADVKWMEKIVSRLNSTIQLNALDAGFYFVDNSLTLNGHGVCGNNISHWIRGVVVKNTTDATSEWSFHPNGTGQATIANAVAGAIAGPSAGGFRSTILPQQTVQQTIPVSAGQLKLIVEVAGPVRAVQVSLVSPSGVAYDRSTKTRELTHQLQSNREHFAVTDPEPGRWTLKVRGANVALRGESVRIDSAQIPKSAFAPVAAIKLSTDRGFGSTSIQFDGSSSTAYNGATVASYSWNFGDGTSSASGPSHTHVFADPGTHIVTLTVTDSKGQSDQATQAVRVTSSNQPPSAAFIWGATDPKTRALVSFDASASTDVDGQVATYAWNFGDGTTGTGIVRDHRYTAPGTYPVTLTATDNAGLKVSFCQAVKTGSFSGGPVLPCH